MNISVTPLLSRNVRCFHYGCLVTRINTICLIFFWTCLFTVLFQWNTRGMPVEYWGNAGNNSGGILAGVVRNSRFQRIPPGIHPKSTWNTRQVWASPGRNSGRILLEFQVYFYLGTNLMVTLIFFFNTVLRFLGFWKLLKQNK